MEWVTKMEWVIRPRRKCDQTNSSIFLEIQLEVCPAKGKSIVTVHVCQHARPDGHELLGRGQHILLKDMVNY